jgi:DNA-nicking Smr family endonuclease
MGRRGPRGPLHQLGELLKRRPAPTRPDPPAALTRPQPADDADLFRSAVRGAQPLAPPQRLEPPPPGILAVPVQSHLNDHAVLAELAGDPSGRDDFYDTGEDETYLRPGVGPDVLRKLRRLEWSIRAELSVRRMTQDEAQAALAVFLRECMDRGLRCVRVIHGKGHRSPNREPVLKRRVKGWLARRDEVLAFCQAPPAAGGGGALIVLLKARR